MVGSKRVMSRLLIVYMKMKEMKMIKMIVVILILIVVVFVVVVVVVVVVEFFVSGGVMGVEVVEVEVKLGIVSVLLYDLYGNVCFGWLFGMVIFVL